MHGVRASNNESLPLRHERALVIRMCASALMPSSQESIRRKAWFAEIHVGKIMHVLVDLELVVWR